MKSCCFRKHLLLAAFVFSLASINGHAAQVSFSGTIIDSVSRAGVSNAMVTVCTRSYFFGTYSSDSTDDYQDTVYSGSSGAYTIIAQYDSSSIPIYNPAFPKSIVVTVSAQGYGTPAARVGVNLMPNAFFSAYTWNPKLFKAVYGEGQVQGTVIDKQNQSVISGALVQVYKYETKIYPTSETIWTLLNEMVTGSDGRFAFSGIDNNFPEWTSLRVGVLKDGFALFDTAFIRSAGTRTIPFPLTFGCQLDRNFAKISGTVLDKSSSQQLPGAKVYLRELVFSSLKSDSCVGYYLRDSALTNQYGYYILDTVRIERKYRVVAVCSGHAADSAFVDVTGITYDRPQFTAGISLRPSVASLSGTITDSLTKRPVPSASVYLKGDVFEKIGQIWRMHDTIYDSVSSNNFGQYRIDSIPDTAYRFIAIQAPGYFTWDDLEPAFQGGSEIKLDLQLKMKTGFKGTVTDSITGKPVYNAIVTLTTIMEIPGFPPRYITIKVDSMRTDSGGVYGFPLPYDVYQTMTFTISGISSGYSTKRLLVTMAESTVVVVPIPLYSLSTSIKKGAEKRPVEVRFSRGKAFFRSSGLTSVRIYSINGRLLTDKIFTKDAVVDLSPWSSSILIVDIRNRSGSRKIVYTGMVAGR